MSSGMAALLMAAWVFIRMPCEDALARIVAHCRRIGTAKIGVQIAHAAGP